MGYHSGKSIGAALHGLGIDYQDRDGEAYFLCPYHDDHQVGSFSVNLVTGQNFCFACGGGGSFEHLVQTLRPGEDVTKFTRGVIRRIGQDTKKADTTKVINEASLALFTDPPERQLQRRNLKLADCQVLGIMWNPEHSSWIIPIRDPYSGELWGWQEKGRTFACNHPRGVRKSRALFGLGAVADNKTEAGRQLIVVESPLDVARLRGAKFPYAVASYGARISREQLRLVERFAEVVIWAFDNDAAGDEISAELRTWRRCIARFYDYGDSDAKDPGEQTDDEIRWGIEHATSALLTRWV
ncbi:MAG: toprim domain-containing protein [Streptosporangiaceae bacterium]